MREEGKETEVRIIDYDIKDVIQDQLGTLCLYPISNVFFSLRAVPCAYVNSTINTAYGGREEPLRLLLQLGTRTPHSPSPSQVGY